MPTGYTAAIADGITFKEYAMSCARAFGALITMRDDAPDAEIPEAFEPSDYYAKALNAAAARLAELNQMDEQSKLKEMEAWRDKQIADAKDAIEKKKDLRAKYDAMLAQVNAYTPPSHEHEGLKKFMAEQINQSIDFDCNDNYHEKVLTEAATITADEWHVRNVAEAQRDVEYYTKHHAEELQRTEGRNRWIKQLRESLA